MPHPTSVILKSMTIHCESETRNQEPHIMRGQLHPGIKIQQVLQWLRCLIESPATGFLVKSFSGRPLLVFRWWGIVSRGRGL